MVVTFEGIKSISNLGKLADFKAFMFLFPGSSAVEHSAVNRTVRGSNPCRGAIFNNLQIKLNIRI